MAVTGQINGLKMTMQAESSDLASLAMTGQTESSGVALSGHNRDISEHR